MSLVGFNWLDATYSLPADCFGFMGIFARFEFCWGFCGNNNVGVVLFWFNWFSNWSVTAYAVTGSFWCYLAVKFYLAGDRPAGVVFLLSWIVGVFCDFNTSFRKLIFPSAISRELLGLLIWPSEADMRGACGFFYFYMVCYSFCFVCECSRFVTWGGSFGLSVMGACCC